MSGRTDKWRQFLKWWLVGLMAALCLVMPPASAADRRDGRVGLAEPVPSRPLQLEITAPPQRQASGSGDRSSSHLTPDREHRGELLTRFEPALLKQLLDEGVDGTLRGIVMMHEQNALSGMDLQGLDTTSRRRAVVRRLQSAADGSQKQVLAMLHAQPKQQVVMVKPLWVVNGIVVEAHKETFWELAAHPDVSIILLDHVRTLPDVGAPEMLDRQQWALAESTQWNVQRVQADRVWRLLGLTGEGVVVANLDSGVDWQHPDLVTRYRGYAGKPLVDHTGNWYCATDEGYTYPGDGLGHGTHTMGTMVGQNGLGVAPGAQWIAVKVFNNQGEAYDSWIHDGFEWALAPNGDPSLAPDVVNGSWGSRLATDERFRPDVQALVAAGIFPVFSAGNYGPTESTMTAPASFGEAFAVGATDKQDQIARFSSRGPSPWKKTKPDVVAPGVGIVSAVPGGGWGVKNGTSMAAPHVAGVVALMLQAQPALTVDQIGSILTGTAFPLGEIHPNNDYGWGLVDAYAAITRAGGFGRLAGTVNDDASGAAIAGAVVQIGSHRGAVTTTATTDMSGAYDVGLGADYYDVSVTAFGYRRETAVGIQIIAGTTTRLDVQLGPLPTGLVRGAIRELGTGNPLKATLFVPGTSFSTTSRVSDGAYSLVLPAGTHTVRIECEAHRVLTDQVTITGGTTVVRNLELVPAPTILLVDSGAWYNDSQRQYYQTALDGLGYLYDEHVIANVDLAPTDVPTAGAFLPYDLVVWSAPLDAPGYIGAADAIEAYLKAGGRLLLSGQDVAFWDGGGNGAFEAPYLRDYLKVSFIQDAADSRTLVGDMIFEGITITIAGEGGADNQFFPDVIAVADPDFATSNWAYLNDGSGGLSVGSCLPYRALVLGFGLEGVNDDEVRQQVLQRSIDWLMAPPQAVGAGLRVGEMPQITNDDGWLVHRVRLRNTSEVNADTFAITIADNVWPTRLLTPSPVTLGSCQSTTLEIRVDAPANAGWHRFDTATLTAASTRSPGLVVTAPVSSKTPAPVLLVDGARFYRLEAQYQDALSAGGIPYDYTRIKGKQADPVPSADTLAMYPLVVWYTGYDWYEPIGDLEEARLIGYLNQGGRLAFSSQDLLYHRFNSPFARDYLGVVDYVEDFGSDQIWGEPKHAMGWGLGPYVLTYPYLDWSDALVPVDGADVVFRNEQGWAAALSHTGKGWRTLFMAVPFEALAPDAAAEVMARMVGWLSWMGRSTWSADRRVVEEGDTLTMTCVLRNDGRAAISAAHVTATLPAGLEMVNGSPDGLLAYDAAKRTLRWQGSMAQGAAITSTFRVRVGAGLSDATTISFPLHIGYDDHHIAFELPTVLRVNSPDLSSSTLQADPVSSPPGRTLSFTLAVRNSGVRAAMATVTATIPSHTTFVGPLHTGGIGAWQVVSDVLFWSGPVAAGNEVLLGYQLELDHQGDYLLRHAAQVSDQYGEWWYPEARTTIWLWKTFYPVVHK